MKKRIFTLLCVLTTAICAMAQNDESDSKIHVVGFFCKNDTMTYQVDKLDYKKVGTTDSIVDRREEYQMQMVVTDSMADGYKIELRYSDFIPDETVQKSMMQKILFDNLGNTPIILKTNELGKIIEVVNWKNLSKILNKTVKQIANEVAKIQGIKDVMDVAVLKNEISATFDTEQRVFEAFDEIALLLGFHGFSFEKGQNKEEIELRGVPAMHYSVVEEIEPTREDDLEGDYKVSYCVISNQPIGDLQVKTENIRNSLKNEEDKEKLDKAVEDAKILTDKEMNVAEFYAVEYFVNGWIKEATKEVSKLTGSFKSVSRTSVYWTTRSWCNWDK